MSQEPLGPDIANFTSASQSTRHTDTDSPVSRTESYHPEPEEACAHTERLIPPTRRRQIPWTPCIECKYTFQPNKPDRVLVARTDGGKRVVQYIDSVNRVRFDVEGSGSVRADPGWSWIPPMQWKPENFVRQDYPRDDQQVELVKRIIAKHRICIHPDDIVIPNRSTPRVSAATRALDEFRSRVPPKNIAETIWQPCNKCGWTFDPSKKPRRLLVAHDPSEENVKIVQFTTDGVMKANVFHAAERHKGPSQRRPDDMGWIWEKGVEWRPVGLGSDSKDEKQIAKVRGIISNHSHVCEGEGEPTILIEDSPPRSSTTIRVDVTRPDVPHLGPEKHNRPTAATPNPSSANQAATNAPSTNKKRSLSPPAAEDLEGPRRRRQVSRFSQELYQTHSEHSAQEVSSIVSTHEIADVPTRSTPGAHSTPGASATLAINQGAIDIMWTLLTRSGDRKLEEVLPAMYNFLDDLSKRK